MKSRKPGLLRLFTAVVLFVSLISGIGSAYALPTEYNNRTVIAYIPLSSYTADVYPDSITVTIGTESKTVKAKFNRAKKLENGSSYDGSADYSCAAMCTKFYREVFGVEVYNLISTSSTPLVKSGGGSFVAVTDKPRVGDIVRFSGGSTIHWAIVKSLENDGSWRVIQQNAWYDWTDGHYTKAEICTVKLSNSNIAMFRYTKPAWANYTKKASLSQTLTVVQGNGDLHIRSYPYGDSLSLRAVKAGDKVAVIRSVENSFGNLWYEVSGGGFIYSGIVTPPESEAPVISNVRVTDISSSGYTVTCDVSDNTGVTQVAFPTWTEENGQDDLAHPWPSVTVNSAANEKKTVSFIVKASEHNDETGRYYTHIYAYDAAGNEAKASQTTVPVLAVDVPEPMRYWHSYQTVSTTVSNASLFANYSEVHNTAYDVARELYLAMGGEDTADVFYLFASTNQSAVDSATPSNPGTAYYAVLEEPTFYTEDWTVTRNVTGDLNELKNTSGTALSPTEGTTYYYKFAVVTLGSVYSSRVKTVKTASTGVVWYNVKQDASTSSGTALFYGDVRFPNAYQPSAVGVYYAADRNAVADATYASHSGVTTLSDSGSNIPTSLASYDSNNKYMSSFWRSNKVTLTAGVTYYYKFFARFTNGVTAYSAVTTYKPSTTATTYQLTLISGGEGGSIVGSGGSYAAGQVISLSAAPKEGYQLQSWSATAGKLSSTTASSVTFTMPASAASVSISFQKINYSLAVRNADGTTAGVDTSVDGAQYHMGDQVSLSASPVSGMRFVRWVSDNGGEFADSESAQTSFTMPAGNVVIVAEYAISDGYYTVNMQISGGGQVQEDASGVHAAGDMVYLNAVPDIGWNFSGWRSDDVVIPNRTSKQTAFTMPNHDVFITAVFNDLEPGWTLDASLSCGVSAAQYRLFYEETTTSQESTLEGWEQTGSTLGDWSSWSAWSTTQQSIPDATLKEQRTRTVYPYYYFVCSSCGAHMPYWSASSSYKCITSLGGCGKTGTIPHESFGTEVNNITVPKSSCTKYDSIKYYTTYNGQKYYYWDDSTASQPKTQYSYRTRTRTYSYIRTVGSEVWQNTPILDSQAEVRILYKLYSEGVLCLPPVSVIEDEAFADSDAIRFVQISGSTGSIGSRAFADCLGLQSAMIPASVTSIAADAFAGCPGLTLFVQEGSAAQSFAQSSGIPYQTIQ